MSQPAVPDRGHLVIMDFHPQAGHEHGGRRPGLVLSPASYNGLVGLVLVCPITSQAKGYIWEVPLPPGLAVHGVVLSDQVCSFDWRARAATYVADAPEAVVLEVLAKAHSLLNPTDDGTY